MSKSHQNSIEIMILIIIAINIFFIQFLIPVTVYGASNTPTITEKISENKTLQSIGTNLQNLPQEETAKDIKKSITLLPGFDNKGVIFSLVQ